MEPLARAPRTLREIAEADLRRAARLVVKIQDEIDPQVRVATPEGDYWIGMTLPGDDDGRRLVLGALETFMVWKEALAFTFAAELTEPDCLWCCAVSARERHACLSRVRRTPRPWTAASFGAVEWLPASSIDPAIAGLLPRERRALTPKDVSAADKWFGRNGRFPAVHIATGEVRGM